MEIKQVGAKWGGGKAAPFLRNKIKIDVESVKSLRDHYQDLVNFYLEPPNYSVSLQEFELYAVERLRLLKQIEAVNCQKELNRYSMEYYYALDQAISRNKNLSTYHQLQQKTSNTNTPPNPTEEQLMAMKIDHISHFLLRLAFARTDEHRKWFIAMEVDFLRYKLSKMTILKTVIEKYKLPFEKVDEKDLQEYYTQILNASFQSSPVRQLGEIYKTDFKQALDLVRSRKVFLLKGCAYVPAAELSGVIGVKFRSYLSGCLSLLKKNIHVIDEDERLRPMLFGFEKRYLGSDSSGGTKSGDVVSCAQLETFSGKSFPLCMKHLYDVVQKDHHLKHWGRLQLGLFFKGIGLPMDEATKFWRSNFTKRPDIDTNRFDKQYMYNIRHMYGQEGKRADYTPYSCMKIIHSNVGPGDHHGCPFKHSDATPLRVKLIDAGISQDGVKDIMKLVEEKHYQLACQKYYELTHDGMTIDSGVHHPNQYFNESRDVLTGKKTIKTEGSQPKTKRAMLYDRSSSQRSTQAKSTDVAPMDLDVETDELLASMDMSY